MTEQVQQRRDTALPHATRRIAEDSHRRLRVMAGPGTGKTFAMMRRVAWLLDSGVPPEEILVCTFTRTAANDIGRELMNLHVEGAGRILATTVHSYCMRVLTQTGALESTGRRHRTLLDFEETFLIEDLPQELFGGVRQKRERLRAFNAAWARLQTDEPGWPLDATDQAFERELLKWLRFHDAMLIGELVPEALRYLRNNPAAPERTAFRHVLVDEYQDLNRAEQSLLDILAEDATMTVIGDEDQSIYSFKYAHPEGIRTFPERHPDAWDESLDECRRCPRRVIAMANHLITQNENREDRTLRPLPTSPEGEVYVVQWDTMEHEAQGIARFIAERTKAGAVSPGSVLVLAPRRLIGYGIRDALKAEEIDAESFFQEELLEGNPRDQARCGAQRAFTLLRLLVDPDDRVALRAYCGFGSQNLRAGHGANSWSTAGKPMLLPVTR